MEMVVFLVTVSENKNLSLNSCIIYIHDNIFKIKTYQTLFCTLLSNIPQVATILIFQYFNYSTQFYNNNIFNSFIYMLLIAIQYICICIYIHKI